MLFTSSTTISLLSLLTTISASPIAFPDDLIADAYYYPATLNIYHVPTGQFEFDAAGGHLSRTPSTSSDITTLANFQFQDRSAGKTCQFNFELDGDYTGAGSAFDVFTTFQAIETDVAQGSTQYRNQYMGRMKSVAGGQAVPFYAGETMEKFQFPCPAAAAKADGTALQTAFEVVPVGESAEMVWTKQDGPWIKIVE